MLNSPRAGPKWPVCVAASLFLLAWATRGSRTAPGVLPTLACLVMLILLLLDTASPAWWERLPLPSWVRRPRLGTVAASVFALTTALVSGFSFTFLFWAAATVVFLKDALARGELGPFDPRLLLRGWRLMLLVGITLASLTFTMTWEAQERITGWGGGGLGPGGNTTARTAGVATVPSLLMFGVLVWASYKGSHPAARLGRFLPLAVTPVLVYLAWRATLPPSWPYGYPGAYLYIPAGPRYFLYGLAPYYVGAVAIIFSRDQAGGNS